MIRIAITPEAHSAIAATIAEGRALEALTVLQDGRVWIWVSRGLARSLASLRRPGESYSDVILRIAGDNQ